MKFSIIIPCYNVAKYIRECLDSVLAQSEPSWEAICTDDGSTDETGRVLEEYAAKDSRIKVIHQANGGLSAARNAALKVASGEWLCYLDGDDMLTPWALETYAKMEQQFPQADILRAGMYTFEDGTFTLPERGNFDAVGVDLSLEVPVYGIDGYFPQMVYRRALLGDIPFVGMSWCEERPYVAKCLARAKFGTDTKIKAYCFRIRGNSITHRKIKPEEVMGYLEATKSSVMALLSEGKRLSQRVAKIYYVLWTEIQVEFICSIKSRTSSDVAWRQWVWSLKELRAIEAPSFWFCISTRAIELMPYRIVAKVLFLIPRKLKQLGIHR